eukprot:355824-Chlamydomonas_euryale.AAC.2
MGATLVTSPQSAKLPSPRAPQLAYAGAPIVVPGREVWTTGGPGREVWTIRVPGPEMWPIRGSLLLSCKQQKPRVLQRPRGVRPLFLLSSTPPSSPRPPISTLCLPILRNLPTLRNPPTCLPIYLPTHLPTYLPTYLPIYLPADLPTYVPTCPPTYNAYTLPALNYSAPGDVGVGALCLVVRSLHRPEYLAQEDDCARLGSDCFPMHLHAA